MRHRAVWLAVLFGGAIVTIFALRTYNKVLDEVAWLVLFLPLVVSSGGNSGSQSATLIIRALTTKEITPASWWAVVWRELLIGSMLGLLLGSLGYVLGLLLAPSAMAALVLPITLILVVTCGTLVGSLLPLLFARLGWDPALMSTPFVACIIDIVGILVYMNVALTLLAYIN
jgi:magnesium transporter